MTLHDVFDTVVLETSMSDDDILQYARQIYFSGKCPTTFTISGYDDDERELWQIPEAVAFMKRMWEVGFGTILKLNLPTAKDHVRGNFGALQLWAAIRGYVNENLTESQALAFTREYSHMCNRCNPRIDGKERPVKAYDGQNRTQK